MEKWWWRPFSCKLPETIVFDYELHSNSNATNAVVKTIGWVFTGSASLFSEAVHSIADTCNQLILVFGLWQSIKKPNPEHP